MLEILRRLLHLVVELLLQVSRGVYVLMQRWVDALDGEEPHEVDDFGGNVAQVQHAHEVEFHEGRRRRLYVVAEGRRPGVYLTWLEAAQQVNGFPNNRHQAFRAR